MSRIRNMFSGPLQFAMLVCFGFAATTAHGQNCGSGGGGSGACANAPNSCFVVNLLGPGCSSPDCCELVCTAEPACCNNAWDEVCVALAEKFCSSCGAVQESCFEPHPTPSCDNGLVCEAVCAVQGLEYCCEISWDKACVTAAIVATSECGAPAAGSCLQPHENPNCRDSTCCEKVCTIDPRCCDIVWDEACVEWATRFCFTCGNEYAQSCCFSHDTPYCDDAVCCEAVCCVDPFCCSSRWDFSCASLATEGSLCNLPDCRCGVVINPSQPALSSCRVVHPTPYCDDRTCCDAVCAFDDFCCLVEWDFVCVETALSRCTLTPNPVINAVCNAATGNCFVVHVQPGCNDPFCCGQICLNDPTCCDVTWDADCVARALLICDGCGDIGAESCFFPHGTPGCLDRECCQDVCDLDPTCCEFEWDLVCVAYAGTICLDSALSCGSPNTRPCAVASSMPACSDAECCNFICAAFDPTCCSRAWDETCATSAIYLCDIGAPNCPGTGDCLKPHGLRGCANEICCEAVCAVDPLCCQLSWSQECVSTAKSVCWTTGACPSFGPCDAVHANPGCEDATCCTVVCEFDPICCEINWSGTCVQAARNLCVADPNEPCPCFGSCFEARGDSAGCNEEICCTAVCAIDPACCTTAWDQGCVTIARVTCCGVPGCGDPCAGSCLVSHTTPFCNDASCCEAVCRFDSYCCDSRWDIGCALSAEEVCGGGCGSLTAGNCFIEHDLPGCERGDCCASVCANEDFLYCCQVRWDADCVERALEVCNGEIPRCGRPGLPGCNIPHGSPSCSDAECCDAVCNVDPFCCQQAWDQDCVDRALITAPDCDRYRPKCGGECAGPCCVPHEGPWCNDEDCCNTVCLIDNFCCTGEWDTTCAIIAGQNCQDLCGFDCGDPKAGSCCVAHENEACSDQQCCEDVCDVDPFCCEGTWDSVCAQIAIKECPNICTAAECGDPDAGDCCQEHPSPFCEDADCCFAVCQIFPQCCTEQWDELCVLVAAKVCGCQ